MRTSDLALVVLIGACVASQARAQENAPRASQADRAARAIMAPLPGAAAKAVPLAPFASARDALQAGVRSYNAGNKAGAAEALEFAAGQGHALALWKLGRMYSAGDGVPQDDLKAFEYYSRIADEFAEETPGTANARIVASAFVALGGYFRDGIKGSYVARNPSRAFEMFQYAASYYGDPEAQYHLSRLYLEGVGTRKDARQAARWVHLSAEKGHVEAQALLGQMMIAGSGVPRQPALGLMWLTLARDSADPQRHTAVITAHEAALAAATQAERDLAMVLLQRHLDRAR